VRDAAGGSVKPRLLFYALCIAAVCFIARAAAAPVQPPDPPSVDSPLPDNPSGEAAYWKNQAQHFQQLAYVRRRRIRQLRASLYWRASSQEALSIAAIVYRVSRPLLGRVASCESTGGSGLNPNAKNLHSTASGLMQILFPSTWRTTPFASFSPFSPYANALAGAYMIAHGRLREWTASEGCWG
jgi:hypothetical protein